TLDSTIATIQREVVQFVDAELSALYLLSAEDSLCLLSTFAVGSSESQQFTRSVTHLRAGQGGELMREVLESKKPLLIKDISKDYRYAKFSKVHAEKSTYRS